jgi:sugar phosphate isomerase/epimerase
MSIQFSVFTKPWHLPIPELGAFVRELGFDAIELPVRPGYQVDPERIGSDLMPAARQLGACGIRIASIAGTADERTIAACAEARVPLIRVMVQIPPECGYLEQVARVQRQFDQLLHQLDSSGVRLGVQNHSDRFVSNASGLRHFLEPFDPRHVCAVWDPAHCALDGELPELAIDIVWSQLGMVNLKNVFWQRTNGPEAELARYEHYWTSGRQGLCSWPTVVRLLRERGYEGVVCLPAEYTDDSAVDRLIAADLSFARSLFESEQTAQARI